jgi:hypothetical protein
MYLDQEAGAIDACSSVNAVSLSVPHTTRRAAGHNLDLVRPCLANPRVDAEEGSKAQRVLLYARG